MLKEFFLSKVHPIVDITDKCYFVKQKCSYKNKHLCVYLFHKSS